MSRLVNCGRTCSAQLRFVCAALQKHFVRAKCFVVGGASCSSAHVFERVSHHLQDFAVSSPKVRAILDAFHDKEDTLLANFEDKYAEDEEALELAHELFASAPDCQNPMLCRTRPPS